MKLFDVYPINDIVISKAKGSRVWDNNDNEYYTPKNERADLSAAKRAATPLAYRKKILIDEIRQQIGRNTNYENLLNKCRSIDKYLEKEELLSGVRCYKCNATLEPHTWSEHFDTTHCIHKCELGHKRK
jgi:hypothetical protein